MIYPEVEINEWCERYGIKQKEITCEDCGVVHKPTRPIAFKNYRGIEYTECEHMNPFTVVPIGESVEIWNALKDSL